MRGIRMRFEEQPGLCRKTRQAIPPPSAAAWRSARKSPTPCSTPTTCCATPEGTERQEKDVAQDLGGLQEYRRITPMALFALQAAADAGEPRVRLNPWRDWPPRRGSARRLRLHVAEHRLQAEQAGIAQGAQFVEADAGEDFHAAQRIGAAQGLLQLAGHFAGRVALAPTVEALPLMVCRVAALPSTSPSPSWRSSWAKRSRVRNEAPQHLDDQLQAAAETPDDIAPRLDQFARVRCRCRRPRAAPAEMTEQAKHQAPCRSASPHGRSCPPPGRLRGRPARRWRSWPGSAARRSARRRGFSGSPRDHRYPASACPSAPRRTARSPPAPAERPPARRRRGPPGALAAQQLGGDLAVQRVVLHYQQMHAPQPLGALHRARRLAGAPCSPCNACSTESASCLGVTGLVRKSTKGGAPWSRASASTSRP